MPLITPDKKPARSTSAESPDVVFGQHAFRQPALLEAALLHPSALSGKSRRKSVGVPYERLEFLGDRVLGLAIAHWLYLELPNAAEGELARRHAALVRRETLAGIGGKLGLLKALKLGPGDRENIRGHLTILGDAVEAVLGAIYLDAGYSAAENFVRRHFKPALAALAASPLDPKTALQEWAQARGHPLPLYTVSSQSGPSHAPAFTIMVTVGNLKPATAVGTSKQKAEKAAAAALLERLTK